MAGEIAREFRKSEADLAHAQAQAHLGSWTLDVKTSEMTWSAETYRLLKLEGMPAPPRYEMFLEHITSHHKTERLRLLTTKL